jgi:RNA polymerase sigma-70 factor (ECF subfamily)
LQAADAENIGQETFLKVARNIKSFDSCQAGATFRGWLYRIARNSLIDYVRTQNVEVNGIGGSEGQTRLMQAEFAAPSVDEDSACSTEETSLLYAKAIELIRAEFSERDWQAFFRSVIDGQEAREIAAELEVTTNVVYLAKSRILRRLKQEFAGLLPDFSR